MGQLPLMQLQEEPGEFVGWETGLHCDGIQLETKKLDFGGWHKSLGELPGETELMSEADDPFHGRVGCQNWCGWRKEWEEVIQVVF